jgi:tRNA(Ile)-lysidine synthase
MKLRDCPPADATALIGVSGGRDSVALLHVLAARGYRLIVCHLDHALRRESRQDAEFVKDLAARLNCECVVRRVNIAMLAQRMKCSIEAAAREARYGFFSRVGRRRGVHRLFLAHHADDQVETLLFNLLRGTGATGLGAMRGETTRGELQILRPLLGVWREEIDRYIAEHGLEFREDASNADPRHTRNRLRHEVVPLLSKVFGREVRRALWRSAEILREEDAWLAASPELVPAQDHELPLAVVKSLPVALQRRLLLAWLRARGIANVGFEEVEGVRGLLTGAVAKVNLPGDYHARRRAGWLFVE